MNLHDLNLPPHRKLILVVALLVAIFSGIYLYQNSTAVLANCAETGDMAANAIQVENAKHFSEFTGPYGRFGFNHPGPLLYYIYALGDLVFAPLTPSSYASHNLTQYALNIYFVFAAAVLVGKVFRCVLFSPIFILSVLFTVKAVGPEIFYFTWGPAALITPVIYFLVSGAVLITSRTRVYFGHIFALVLALQTHLGTVTVLVPLEIIIVALILRRGAKTKQSEVRQLLAGFAFGAILFLPTIFEMLSNWPNSNINRIISFFQKNRGSHGWSEGLTLIQAFYNQVLGSNQLTTSFPVVFLLTLLLFYRKERFISSLTFLLITGSALAAFAATRVVGDLLPYIFWYQYGFVSLAIFVSLSFIIHLSLRARAMQMTADSALFSVIVGIFGLFLTKDYYRAQPSPLCDDTVTKLVEYIKPEDGVLYQIQIRRQGQWHIGTGIGAYLARHEIPFCVTPRWEIIFGKRYVCGARYKINEFDNTVSINLYSANKYQGEDRERGVIVDKTLMIIRDPATDPK